MGLELTGPFHGVDSDQRALLLCTSTEPALWASQILGGVRPWGCILQRS